MISLGVGTLVLLPVGVAGGGHALLDPWLLLAGLGVALLSSAVPYSLEMQALRRLPTRVFGVLMSLEPAVAALVGLAVLGERLEARAVVAVLVVTAAAAAPPLRQAGPSRITGFTERVHRTVGRGYNPPHEPGVAKEEPHGC